MRCIESVSARCRRCSVVLAISVAVVLWILFAVFSVSCGANGGSSAREVSAPSATVTFLNVTDLHGALLTGDKEGRTGKAIGGASFVAAHIEAEKAKADGPVFVLASGDMMQGTAISNMSMGEPVIAFMNAVGFEACAIGNHEFDWGIDVLKERMKQAQFPFLGANISVEEGATSGDWLVSHTVLEKENIKVGVIGVITEETPIIVNPKCIEGLIFSDAASSANKIAAQLRKERVPLIIVLAHIGGMQEDGAVVGPIKDFASKLQGVDAVFGGHSHTIVSGMVDSIPVIIAGANGHSLGVLKLGLDSATGQTKILEEAVKPVYNEGIEPNKDVATLVEAFRLKVAKQMDRVIAVAAEDIRHRRGESQLGNLVCDVMREAVGAQIAFENSGGIRADIDAGPVTVGQIYRIIPFDNTIVTMEFTGKQVRQALEEGTSETGVVQVSGIRYSYAPEAPAGQRVNSIVLEDGQPIDPDKLYLVATNDYMANGGDRFAVFQEGKKIRNTQVLLRDALVSWMDKVRESASELHPPALGRAELVRQ